MLTAGDDANALRQRPAEERVMAIETARFRFEHCAAYQESCIAAPAHGRFWPMTSSCRDAVTCTLSG
jgi:hypothetical protein